MRRALPQRTSLTCAGGVGLRNFDSARRMMAVSKKALSVNDNDDDDDDGPPMPRVHWFPEGVSHKGILAHSFFPLVQEQYRTTTLRLPSWDLSGGASTATEGYTEADFDYRGWVAVRNLDHFVKKGSALESMLNRQCILPEEEGVACNEETDQHSSSSSPSRGEDATAMPLLFPQNIPFCPRKMLLTNELPEFSADYHGEPRDQLIPSFLDEPLLLPHDSSKDGRRRTAVRPQLCLDAVGLIGGFEPADMNRNANLSRSILEHIASAEAVQTGLVGASARDRHDLHGVRKQLRKYFDLEGRIGCGDWGDCQMLLTLPLAKKVFSICDTTVLPFCSGAVGAGGGGGDLDRDDGGGNGMEIIGERGVSVDDRFKSIVMRIGFGNNHTDIASINLEKCDTQRKGQRQALGFSLELLKERLPAPLILATRRLHSVCRESLPRDAVPPPLYWLSTATHVANNIALTEKESSFAKLLLHTPSSDEEVANELVRRVAEDFLERSGSKDSASDENVFLPGEDFARLDTVATLKNLAQTKKDAGFWKKWMKLFS